MFTSDDGIAMEITSDARVHQILGSAKVQSVLAATLARADFQAMPIIAGESLRGTPLAALDPATHLRIGVAEEADLKMLDLALRILAGYIRKAMPARERAEVLEHAALLLEDRIGFFVAICVKESGMRVEAGLAECLQAIAYCRFYAAIARQHFASPHELPGPTGESNRLFLQGRGVFACISSWKSPLAIFLGQIAAAFVVGNAVVAKPAERTEIAAYEVIKLLGESGIPKDAIALLPGRGDVIGAELVSDYRIAGIAFHGNLDTAQTINRALAIRSGPLIPFVSSTDDLKPGGAEYMFRFASERVVTINTAAAGGNAALIASSE